jgi:putative FmdB family regulatory protein
MPTYEYKCEACGHAFEKFQSIMAGPIRKCPKCGKRRVRRLLGTGSGMIFKGSGFYTTDYRSEGYKTAAKADSGASTSETKGKDSSGKDAAGKDSAGKDSAKPATSSTESKPAAKTESKPTKK